MVGQLQVIIITIIWYEITLLYLAIEGKVTCDKIIKCCHCLI